MINTENVFAELILGITLLTQEQPHWKHDYPAGLIRAMNVLALEMGATFPKTFSAFLAKCHEPLSAWYPYPLTNFTWDYALLDDGQLTEQASDYLYTLSDELLQRHQKNGFIPSSVLDNWEVLRFIQRMRAMENKDEAQRLYTTIRSFLIEHSWITRKDLGELKRQDVSEDDLNWLKTAFYQQYAGNDEAYYCDRCGILTQVNEHLSGIKPSYCDDHDPGLPHVHGVSVSNYARMKAGVHLRTFIPGRAERALFEEAEMLQDEYPRHLVEVIRYPGVDAYDLRLVFRDEAWAVDIKDIADPQDLSRKILPMDDGGILAHNKAFYVVPDRRLRLMHDYLEQVRRHRGKISPPLHLVSQQAFYTRMREKCVELDKSSR